MATIYLLRHGESVFNVKQAEIVGGRSNHIALTDQGMAQARKAGAWLAAHDIVPTIVVASPALRARSTIQEALQTMGVALTVTTDERIQELSQGIMEGQPRAEVWTGETIAILQRDPMNFAFPDGETFYDVQDRMLAWYREMVSTHPDGIILAGSHGLAIRALVGALLGWDHADINQATTPNCSLTRIDHVSNTDTVLYIGKDIAKSIDENV